MLQQLKQTRHFVITTVLLSLGMLVLLLGHGMVHDRVHAWDPNVKNSVLGRDWQVRMTGATVPNATNYDSLQTSPGGPTVRYYHVHQGDLLTFSFQANASGGSQPSDVVTWASMDMQPATMSLVSKTGGYSLDNQRCLNGQDYPGGAGAKTYSCGNRGESVYKDHNPGSNFSSESFSFTYKVAVNKSAYICVRGHIGGSPSNNADNEAASGALEPVYAISDFQCYVVYYTPPACTGTCCGGVCNTTPDGHQHVEEYCDRAVFEDNGITDWFPTAPGLRSQTVISINGTPGVSNAIIGDGHSKSYTPTPFAVTPGTNGTVTYVVTHYYWNGTQWLPYTDNNKTLVCNGPNPINPWYYHASCANATISGNLGGNNVVAGSTFTVTLTIANDGPLPLPGNMAGAQFPLVLAWGDENAAGSAFTGFVLPIWNGLAVGESRQVSFTLTAPGSVGSYPFVSHPAYANNFAFTAPSSCPTSVNVYQPFTIVPSASTTFDGTSENPTQVRYTTSINNLNGVPVPVPTNSHLDKNAVLQRSYVDISRSYPSGNTTVWTGGMSAAPIAAGDQYCTYLTVPYTSGYVGPGGSVIPNPGASTVQNCQTVHNEPYVRAHGADVRAGGAFSTGSTICAPSSGQGGIYTYTTPNGPTTQAKGSGSQLAAMAYGPIKGFSSAVLRTTTPVSHTGLSFANNSTSMTGNNQPTLGGSLGGSHCIGDYYGTKPSSTQSLGGSIGPSSDGAYSGGAMTISGGTVASGHHVAIYASGDVQITGNITTNTGSWTKTKDIPSLYIITTGNIYIAGGVTQLDGLYVAQSTGSKGKIYTCASGAAQVDPNALLGTCRKQLLVNGAFVANQVLLDRSYGSLRYAKQAEHPGGAGGVCDDNNATSTIGDCSAEIFNFTPDMLFTDPAVTPSSGPSLGKYDYITSLAPVL